MAELECIFCIETHPVADFPAIHCSCREKPPICRNCATRWLFKASKDHDDGRMTCTLCRCPYDDFQGYISDVLGTLYCGSLFFAVSFLAGLLLSAATLWAIYDCSGDKHRLLALNVFYLAAVVLHAWFRDPRTLHFDVFGNAGAVSAFFSLTAGCFAETPGSVFLLHGRLVLLWLLYAVIHCFVFLSTVPRILNDVGRHVSSFSHFSLSSFGARVPHCLLSLRNLLEMGSTSVSIRTEMIFLIYAMSMVTHVAIIEAWFHSVDESELIGVLVTLPCILIIVLLIQWRVMSALLKPSLGLLEGIYSSFNYFGVALYLLTGQEDVETLNKAVLAFYAAAALLSIVRQHLNRLRDKDRLLLDQLSSFLAVEEILES